MTCVWNQSSFADKAFIIQNERANKMNTENGRMKVPV